ncbi:hypothetical protein [Nocardia africana]|nr:hypothetical protein [Nocardia africana]MCC3313682.1 hypothetical protein [Nocardia africana]
MTTTPPPQITSPSETSTPPPIRTDVRLPENGDLRRSIDTVSVNCTGIEETKVQTASVFDTAAGRFVGLPAPPVPAGAELIDYFCAIAGSGKDIRVVYLTTIRTPASGLTAEKTESSITSFTPGATSPTAQVPWPAGTINARQLDKLYPTKAGLLVTGSGLAMMFDNRTLALKWQNDFRPDYVSNDAIAHRTGQGVSFLSAETGRDIGHFDGGDLIRESSGHVMENIPQGLRDGFLLQHNNYPDASIWYFDSRTNQLAGPLADGGFVTATSMDGDNVLIYGSGVPAALLRVYNLATHRFLVDKTGADAQGLNVDAAFLAGRYLYLRSQKDGNSVVDIETNRKLAGSWSLLPMDTLNDWRLVIDGSTVTNDYSKCFDFAMDYVCYEKGRLVRTANGSYPGPWY